MPLGVYIMREFYFLFFIFHFVVVVVVVDTVRIRVVFEDVFAFIVVCGSFIRLLSSLAHFQ